MPRTPRNLRPRVRKADKEQITLSKASSPSLLSTMASDGTSTPVDIEAMITKALTSDDIIDKLVNKLVGKLKDAVLGALSEKLERAQEEISQLKDEVAGYKSKLAQVDSRMLLKSDDLEQYTRRNNIRIFGLPEAEGENSDDLVIKVFKDRLKLDIPVERLDRTHRVGRQPAPAEDGTQRWRPIIVRFTSYRDRRRVFNAKKLLKGTNISIREDLTALRMEVFRAAANRFGHRNTWSLDGRILWTDSAGQKGTANHMTDLPK